MRGRKIVGQGELERAEGQALERTIQLVTQSPVTTALLRSATSMMCVLNEQHQIVTLNTAYLDSLEVAHSDDVIGLRPGEAMHCAHANDHPRGCGMSAHCKGCEIANAIVASQQMGRPVQSECVISVCDRKGNLRDVALAIRAAPFELEGEQFTVFCMTDVSQQRQHASLERTFLHDLSNLVTALAASGETLQKSTLASASPLVNDICDLTRRLSREIVFQRLLLSREPAKYRPGWQSVKIPETLTFLQRMFCNHPVAMGKRLVIVQPPSIGECVTDASLLERVLINMLLNAFEATTSGKEVRLTTETTSDSLRFSVWNAECMEDSIRGRVFQRHFSTKKGAGRGQGTYAIRLLGETLLHGKVGFSSTPETGTTFHLELSRNPAENGSRTRP